MLKKINKRTARKLFNEGKTIGMLPCKTSVGNAWVEMYEMCNKAQENFDKLVDYFTYYNCNSELGKYPAYYTEV